MHALQRPLVSIVIPCHNEEDTVEVCVESFLRQSYPNIEIIVVDDHSTDGTCTVLQKYRNMGNVKIIRNDSNYGEGYSRNVGIKVARGEIVIEAECDGKYPPDYVEKMIAPLLEDKNTGGAIPGKRIVWSDKDNVLVRYWNKRFLAAYILTLKGKRPVIGAWAFRRGVLEEVGLYDETLPCGTDVDLVNRIKGRGYKIAFVADTYFYHRDPDTFKKFIRRIWWGSIKCKRFRERWGLEPKGFRKLFFTGRNISALLLPVYPVLALIHNILWLLIFFGVFFAESVFPILYDRELRLTFKLALEDGDYRLALALPFICWVEIRTRALGIFYAMLKG